jgi:NAD(P)-dependent dehydrogenase (short-subunit alcohol dehydrogenase family)
MAGVVLVTGASRGIGRATALKLAAEGYNVVVHYHRREDAAMDVVASIHKVHQRAIAVQADLANESDIERMFLKIDEAKLGPLMALVNNGGVSGGRVAIENVNYLDLNKIFSVNVFACFVTIREAVNRMKHHGQGGAIVNVSSEAAKFGGNMITPYAATKGSVQTMTLGLSRELASYNIRINAVSPAVIETDAHGDISEERRAFLKKTIPLGRLGKAEEVAEAIVWLLSEKASYVTGSVLAVSGGR